MKKLFSQNFISQKFILILFAGMFLGGCQLEWRGKFDMGAMDLSFLASDKAFIIDDVLYMFSEDGLTLTKSEYVSGEPITVTEYVSGNFVTYKNGTEKLFISNATASGVIIDGESVEYFPLGKVSQALASVTGIEGLYDDFLRVDSNGKAYFLSDEVSSISFDDFFKTKNYFSDKDHVDSHVTDIVAPYINKEVPTSPAVHVILDDDGTLKEPISGPDRESVKYDDTTGTITICQSVFGDVYIEGNIVVSSGTHGIYVKGDVRINGNIFVDGNITVDNSSRATPAGIYIDNGTDVCSIIVTGKIDVDGNNMGGTAYGIAIHNSLVQEDIFVNGIEVKNGGCGDNGIYLYSSSVDGSVIVNRDIFTRFKAITSVHSSVLGDIIVNGNLTSVVSLCLMSSNIKGDVIIKGSVNSTSKGIGVYKTEVGDIIINSDLITSGSGITCGIQIEEDTSIDNIIVNGIIKTSATSTSGTTYGIIADNVKNYDIGDIIVDGSITATGGRNNYGIYIGYSSYGYNIIGDIIVNGSIDGSGGTGTNYGIYVYNTLSEVSSVITKGPLTDDKTYKTDNIPIYDNAKNIYTYRYYAPDMGDKYDFTVYGL